MTVNTAFQSRGTGETYSIAAYQPLALFHMINFWGDFFPFNSSSLQLKPYSWYTTSDIQWYHDDVIVQWIMLNLWCKALFFFPPTRPNKIYFVSIKSLYIYCLLLLEPTICNKSQMKCSKKLQQHCHGKAGQTNNNAKKMTKSSLPLMVKCRSWGHGTPVNRVQLALCTTFLFCFFSAYYICRNSKYYF